MAMTQTPAPGSNWIAHIGMLVNWNLFMIRRRLITKILFGILIGILFLAAVLIPFLSGTLIETFYGFPDVFGTFGNYLNFMAPLLLCILTGAVVGSEYNFGIQRQMLARGSSRTQVFIGQVVTFAILALFTTLFFFLVATLLGFFAAPLLGVKPVMLTANQWISVFNYALALALKIWLYMLITMLIATLGRSAIAGISFALGYIVLESILANVLEIVGVMINNDLGKWLSNVPDYFPGMAASTLVTYTSNQVFPPDAFQIKLNAVPHINLPVTLLTIGVYVVGIMALTLMVYKNRDIAD